jgi:hypothetical protein
VNERALLLTLAHWAVGAVVVVVVSCCSIR